ncbi:HSP70/90 co-chaperone [Microbotryomycetes sp. JL201]|nr:HSP70/90 co-chaperone [Microbotryomycetes sp. JL201]
MATAPERPPESRAGAENPFAGWDSVPLFMKSLPESFDAQDDKDSNLDTLAALQALAYDGTPKEIADGFKEQGNTLFMQRKFKEAAGFYTRALDECGKDLDTNDKRTLWANRAACNLELGDILQSGNYGSTLRDTSSVLAAPRDFHPESAPASWTKTDMKVLLRAARALCALDKLPEALDALQRLQLLEQSIGEQDKDVGKKWRDEVQAKIDIKTRRDAEKNERERRRKEMDRTMTAALTYRGVLYPRPTPQKPLFHSCPTDVTPPHFDRDSLPPQSSPDLPLVPTSASAAPFVPWAPPPVDTPIVFPCFLLMPLAQPPTRDLCLEFHEQATFGDMLRSMEHDPSQTQLYVATHKGRVLKVGAKLSLNQVLVAAAKEAQDGCVLQEGWAFEFVGVPKGSQGDEWVQQWKHELQSGKQAIL